MNKGGERPEHGSVILLPEARVLEGVVGGGRWMRSESDLNVMLTMGSCILQMTRTDPSQISGQQPALICFPKTVYQMVIGTFIVLCHKAGSMSALTWDRGWGLTSLASLAP